MVPNILTVMGINNKTTALYNLNLTLLFQYKLKTYKDSFLLYLQTKINTYQKAKLE